MKAIRLYPGYHGYDLGAMVGTPDFDAVMHVAAECGLPVCVALLVEDPRQHHFIVQPLPVAPGALIQMIRTYPSVNFVLERVSLGVFKAVAAGADTAANWFVETSSRFLMVRPQDCPDYPHCGLPDLIEVLGSDRVLFGTDLPLQYPHVAMMKIAALGLDAETTAKVMGLNAARLLGLEPPRKDP